MTAADITRELRAARPLAPADLRSRVLADATRRPPAVPSLAERLGTWARRPLVALPAVAALAVAVTVGIAVGRPAGDDDRVASPPVSTATGSVGGAEAAQDLRAAPAAKAGASGDARAQRIAAWLSLRVDDGDAVATASAEAIRIVRSLDGYVVRSDVTAGDDGGATLSLRVPSAAAQEAVARLSALGTIVGQRVVADDLQDGIDARGDEILRLRAQLATVRARLASEDLPAAERAALQARRDLLASRLAQARAERASLTADAAEATVDVEIRSASAGGGVPPPSRFDRTLGRALDLLAWEALVVLGLLVVLAPAAIVLTAAWAARRRLRRRGEEGLLGLA